jgi:hypothetical protein
MSNPNDPRHKIMGRLYAAKPGSEVIHLAYTLLFKYGQPGADGGEIYPSQDTLALLSAG